MNTWLSNWLSVWATILAIIGLALVIINVVRITKYHKASWKLAIAISAFWSAAAIINAAIGRNPAAVEGFVGGMYFVLFLIIRDQPQPIRPSSTSRLLTDDELTALARALNPKKGNPTP